MQTVATSLQLFDNFSKILNRVNQAVETTTKHMDKLQHAMNGNIDMDIDTTSAARKMDSMISKADSLGNSMESSAADMSRSFSKVNQSQESMLSTQNRVNNSLRTGSREAEGIVDQIKGIAAAYLSLQAASGFLGQTLGGAMEQISFMDTFTARSGSEALGQAIYDEITKQALKAGQSVNEALSGSMSFMSNTMDPK
ncbi:hypothetical protein ACFSVM_25790, partial [Paenibacillus shunpengii]